MDPKNNGSNDSHPVAKSLAKSRILLVDDNDNIRAVFQEGLERRGFEVIPASTVSAALNLISTQKFDVLLSDLHMPNAGDGLTVVSAMRHAHPNAITLVQSGYPAMEEATTAILTQVDEIIAKPAGLAQIAEIISKKLSNPKARMASNKEKVATILERAMDSIIRNWMTRVESNEELTAIKLSSQERTGHLPLLVGDLVRRLHLVPTTQALISKAAREHGILRRNQGYTIAMVVEESRMLQVTIFETLQNNLGEVDFSTVLLDVMAIADEVDAQLKQTVLGFMEAVPLKPVSLSA
jgi:ActR/RegA family two-component response regulator